MSVTKSSLGHKVAKTILFETVKSLACFGYIGSFCRREDTVLTASCLLRAPDRVRMRLRHRV